MTSCQALLCLLLVSAAAAAPATPHILFILADDYGYNDVGYHESKVSGANPGGEKTSSPIGGEPMTPMLDKLAAESMRLEMYVVLLLICSCGSCC